MTEIRAIDYSLWLAQQLGTQLKDDQLSNGYYYCKLLERTVYGSRPSDKPKKSRLRKNAKANENENFVYMQEIIAKETLSSTVRSFVAFFFHSFLSRYLISFLLLLSFFVQFPRWVQNAVRNRQRSNVVAHLQFLPMLYQFVQRCGGACVDIENEENEDPHRPNPLDMNSSKCTDTCTYTIDELKKKAISPFRQIDR